MANFFAVLGMALCGFAIWWLWREGCKEILHLRTLNRYNRLERTMVNRYLLADSGPHYIEAIEFLEAEIRELIRVVSFDTRYPKVTHECILLIDDKARETLDALRAKLPLVEEK